MKCDIKTCEKESTEIIKRSILLDSLLSDIHFCPVHAQAARTIGEIMKHHGTAAVQSELEKL